MARSYKFCLVQFPAHPLRDEQLNLALAVFREGFLDVRATRRLEKVKAISAAVDVEQVQRSVDRLEELDARLATPGSSAEERHGELQQIAPFRLTRLGEFVAADEKLYEQQIAVLLANLVEPEPAPVLAVKKPNSTVLRSVKSALRLEGVLAKKGEGLEGHRIVSNHQIAAGLKADLLLQNGAMHVVEAVDASSDDGSLFRAIQRIAISALVFEHARMNFGEQKTKSQLVYAASAALEASIKPSLHAAEHQGARLVNWLSDDDRRLFVTHLSGLAIPVKTKKRKAIHIDGSVQPRFKLN